MCRKSFRRPCWADKIIERLLYTDPQTGEHIRHRTGSAVLQKQKRLVLDLNGRIDPTRIEDYIASGGYTSLAKVLPVMTPEQIIAEVKASGLRGRGGAGFSTGMKWELCRQQRPEGRRRAISFATPTKATRALSWTAR